VCGFVVCCWRRVRAFDELAEIGRFVHTEQNRKLSEQLEARAKLSGSGSGSASPAPAGDADKVCIVSRCFVLSLSWLTVVSLKMKRELEGLRKELWNKEKALAEHKEQLEEARAKLDKAPATPAKVNPACHLSFCVLSHLF
jgi:hypothetical protein